jgi:hypothetical protein
VKSPIVAAVQNSVVEVKPRPELEEALPETVPQEPKIVRSKSQAPRDENALPDGVVGLTIRLPIHLQRALMRGAFERKFRRERPFTQQEIAAEALTLWLKRNGFLD